MHPPLSHLPCPMSDWVNHGCQTQNLYHTVSPHLLPAFHCLSSDSSLPTSHLLYCQSPPIIKFKEGFIGWIYFARKGCKYIIFLIYLSIYKFLLNGNYSFIKVLFCQNLYLYFEIKDSESNYFLKMKIC